MRRTVANTRVLAPKLARSEFFIYVVAVLAAAVLILYPIWALFRYAWTSSEAPFAAIVEVLTDPRVHSATLNSLQLAGGTTILATIIGVGLAVVVGRTNTPLARVVEPVGILPLLTMPFVGAVAWSLLASPRTGFINVVLRNLFNLDMELGPFNVYTMPGLIWVMGLFYSPYVFILTSSALRSIDSSLEEAARLCGASPSNVLRHTTIPLVTPAILSGAFLTFSFSAGQFSIPQIIGVPARIEVLPTVIYAEAQNYPINFAKLTGVAFELLVIAGAALVLQRYWLSRRNYEVVSGKGSRIQRLDLGAWKYAVLMLILPYVLVVIVFPFLALLTSSFLKYSATTLTWDLLTLANYREIWENQLTVRSIKNSLVLGTVSATLCMALALVVSYIVHRTRLRGRSAVHFLSMLPLGFPGIVFAVGVLAAWITPPIVLFGTMAILVVSYVAHFLPTATQSASSGLVQIGREIEDSARVSGAPWLSMVRRILFPLTSSALIGGWLLLFITMFRELANSVLLYTPGKEVVAVALLNLWEAGSYSPVAAFSIIITIITFLVFILLQRLSSRSRRGLQK